MNRVTFLRVLVLLTIATATLADSASSQTYSARDLYIRWVGVVDNGEGAPPRFKWDPFRHGHKGNLHLNLYSRGRKVEIFDHTKKKYVSDIVIRGPSEDEFIDGDQKCLDRFVYIGRISPRQTIRVYIWESDPGGAILGRGHDVLFDREIDGPGIWRSKIRADKKARKIARRRRADRWIQKVWSPGLKKGIPAMFVEIGEEHPPCRLK